MNRKEVARKLPLSRRERERIRMKKVAIVLLIILLLAMSTIFADIGDFFSSDSDWGGGYDYSKVWGDDYDSGWSSRSSYYSTGNGLTYSPQYNVGYDGTILKYFFFVIGGVLCFSLGVVFLKAKNKKPQAAGFYRESGRDVDTMPEYMPNYNGNLISDELEYTIIHSLAERDLNFNRENFLFYAQKIFISLQKAWSRKDFKTLQSLENVDLFEQHKAQIEKLTENDQTNVVDLILVRNVEFMDFYESGGKDALSVLISCSMIDYLKKNQNGKVVSGDEKARINRLYKMTLVRDHDAKTPEDGSVIEKDVECPNCGAHMKITYSKECKHCGTFLVGSEQDWIVSNIEPFVIPKTDQKKAKK